MLKISFVLACSILGCHASGGDSHEERVLTKPLAAMLMAADPVAAWQVAGAGHARVPGAKAAGAPRAPLLRPFLRGPQRHREVQAQEAGIPGFPTNPILDEIEEEELAGIDEYSLASGFDNLNDLEVGPAPNQAVTSRGFGSHENNEIYKDVATTSEKRSGVMTGDFMKGAFDEEKIRYQETDGPIRSPTASSASLTGGYFDNAILSALQAMPKEALVDFLRRLASSRRDEVAAALQLVPKASVKIDAVEKDANWAADKAAFEQTMAAAPNVTDNADISRAFSGTSAAFYEEKSDERKERIAEGKDLFDKVYMQNQDQEENMVDRSRMPLFIDKTWGADKKKIAETKASVGEDQRDYFDWDHLDDDERDIVNDGYSADVFKEPDVELDEDGLPITKAFKSRGFSAEASDTARTGAVHKERGSAGDTFEVFKHYSDHLPDKGVISLEQGEQREKGDQVFDFDMSMQKLWAMKETMDPEEWAYIFSDEDMEW